jgi:hypothetical protein
MGRHQPLLDISAGGNHPSPIGLEPVETDQASAIDYAFRRSRMGTSV